MAEPRDHEAPPAPRRTRLERGAIGIMVACGLIVGGITSAWWFRDREATREIAELHAEADREKAVIERITDIERVFSERANLSAASAAANFAELRLSLQVSTAQLLAAIDKVVESLARVKSDHDALQLVAITRDRLAAWAMTLDTLN